MAEKCMIHKVDRHYKRCDNTDIAVTIYYKGQMIPLCMQCWRKIAKSRREWNSS